MPIKKNKRNSLYGYPAPTSFAFPAPIVSNINPTVFDFGELGQGWINKVTATPFQLTQISAGQFIWTQLSTSGGSGVFSSLTVTPGPTSITGTTSINTSGSAVTTIGTGGTGAVHIGNATGNTLVTGTLTSTVGLTAGTSVVAGTGITATTGNITASTGNVVSTLGAVVGVGVIATGDAGTGIAAETIFTNVAPANAGGTGVCVIQTNSGTGTPDNVGFMKVYIGTTAYYVPYFSSAVL